MSKGQDTMETGWWVVKPTNPAETAYYPTGSYVVRWWNGGGWTSRNVGADLCPDRFEDFAAITYLGAGDDDD